MNTIHKHLLASVIAIAVISPAMADKNQNNDCDNTKLETRLMGKVDEATLQKHIDKLTQQMKRIRHGRGSITSQKKELRRHASDMQTAMQELHNQMYAGGCKGALHGASLKTRVEEMEKRVAIQQQLMEQMIAHNLEEKAE
jgi:septal ring factor EnvC (AmiA/AmiB activator)